MLWAVCLPQIGARGHLKVQQRAFRFTGHGLLHPPPAILPGVPKGSLVIRNAMPQWGRVAMPCAPAKARRTLPLQH